MQIAIRAQAGDGALSLPFSARGNVADYPAISPTHGQPLVQVLCTSEIATDNEPTRVLRVTPDRAIGLMVSQMHPRRDGEQGAVAMAHTK